MATRLATKGVEQSLLLLRSRANGRVVWSFPSTIASFLPIAHTRSRTSPTKAASFIVLWNVRRHRSDATRLFHLTSIWHANIHRYSWI